MILLSAQYLYAAESETALKPIKLSATDGKYFQSKSGAKFAISNKIFKSKEEAKAFCDQKLLPMAGEFELFYLIMSDQKDTDSLLKGVSFELKNKDQKVSGAWIWNSDKSIPGDVTILRDGAGTSTETIKLSEMDALMKEQDRRSSGPLRAYATNG